MNAVKPVVIVFIAALVGAFFLLDLDSYFSLDFFQSRRLALLQFKEAYPVLSSALYFGLYVVVAALALPVAGVLTVIGGAVFGFWWALLLVSFASTLGATLAFLTSRILLREWVHNRFGKALKIINQGMRKDGHLYLFTLRLIPAIPFFMVNIAMALTPISTPVFYLVSQAGMLPGTLLYVNLGVQLGPVTTVSGILSIGVIRAFLLLALFPWAVRIVTNWYRKRRLTRRGEPPVEQVEGNPGRD